jgi:hypothetical protein
LDRRKCKAQDVAGKSAQLQRRGRLSTASGEEQPPAAAVVAATAAAAVVVTLATATVLALATTTAAVVLAVLVVVVAPVTRPPGRPEELREDGETLRSALAKGTSNPPANIPRASPRPQQTGTIGRHLQRHGP